MSHHKFVPLDAIAGQIMDKILRLPLTELEMEYILKELYRMSFSITARKIKRIKNSRVEELREINKQMREEME